MKKILTIALIALIAASTVFAGISGSSSLGFGYNSSSKKFGFNPSASLTMDVDVASDNASKVGEGDVYAGIDASVSLKLLSNNSWTYVPKYDSIENSDGSYYTLALCAAINDAYIAGQDWKVSFGTASSNPVDFAQSPVDTYKTALKDIFDNPYWVKNANVSYKASYTSNSGVEASYKDYKVGVGFVGGPAPEEKASEVVVTEGIKGKTLIGFTAYFLTPSIELGDANVKFGAVGSKAEYTSDTSGTVEKDSKAYTSLGASLEAGYAVEAFSGKVAADFGIENVKKDNKFHVDVLANVKYDFVALDVYYVNSVTYTPWKLIDYVPVKQEAVTINNLFSAKVAVDLASFEVPVSFTVKAKDLVNKQDLSLSADIAVNEKLSLTVGGGYVIKSNKFSVNGGVKYVAELFTASASAKFSMTDGAKQTLVPEVVVSSDALVNGATLELSWKSNSDGSDDTTTNLLDGSKDWGKVYATAKISF